MKKKKGKRKQKRELRLREGKKRRKRNECNGNRKKKLRQKGRKKKDKKEEKKRQRAWGQRNEEKKIKWQTFKLSRKDWINLFNRSTNTNGNSAFCPSYFYDVKLPQKIAHTHTLFPSGLRTTAITNSLPFNICL